MRSISRWLMYNLWYFRRPPWDTGVSPPELLSFIKENPPGRAMDLGCGTGTNVITLARHGWRVYGVDFAAQAVARARRKVKRAGLKANLDVSDVSRIRRVKQPFDLVLDIGCLHSLSLEERAGYTTNLESLLAPGGTYLLYAFIAEEGSSVPGLSEDEVLAIAQRFRLVKRQDGSDRSGRKSAWLTFQK